MRRRRPSLLRALIVGALALAVAACVQTLTRTLVAPEDMATLDDRSPFLKAHLRGGSVYVLSSWSVDGERLVGEGSLLDTNRAEVESGRFELPADSVLLFETNVVDGAGANTAITVMAGITAFVAGICAASPKTCFGSCPTYYVADEDGHELLQAEGFSSSIAPALEATDVDMLLRARPQGRTLDVRVTNEAFETHVIRHTDLLAAPRPESGRVFVTPDGAFRETSEPLAPTRCSAAEGDCLGAVIDADGVERFVLADSSDLAAREEIELFFEDVPAGDLGLVIRSRQTLMTTYLIYQALAYLGDDAGRWLAALETGDDTRDEIGAIGRLLGNIEVLTPDADGAWRVVGGVGETGPLAADTKVVPLHREATDGTTPLRLRLRLVRGLWRLDMVGLVRLGGEVEPVRILPTSVRRDGVEDREALRLLVDRAEPLVTLPGDAYEITYTLPEDPPAHELFLEARGYYLEWMRQEWIAEQNGLAAARLVFDPAGTLRALAPAYKRLEPEIESLFWNSRYVRD